MLSLTNFSSQFPIALFPVRIQTKFVKNSSTFLAQHTSRTEYELRIRVYPDQLGVSTHQSSLTTVELEAGKNYWLKAADANQQSLHSLSEWRGLVQTFGVNRALWITQQTTPSNQQNRITHIAKGILVEPVFPTLTTETATFPTAHSLIMPDYFSAILYRQATTGEVTDPLINNQLVPLLPNATYATASIPEPTTEFLVEAKRVDGAAIGSAPLQVGPELSDTVVTIELDETTDLGVDARINWLLDFEEALTKGMALVIPFASEAEYRREYKRLLIVGVRANTSASDGGDLLQQVLQAHQYTDGLSILRQGTPTNNTESAGAGYDSSSRFDAEASFALLLQSDQLGSTLPSSQADWKDGHYLAAALGIPVAALTQVEQSSNRDIEEAKAMNKALWPATYGYFLSEMLDPLFSDAAISWTQDFFERYVLGRGLVPAFRAGTQPYGVLPTTRYSTWTPTTDTGSFGQNLQRILRQLDVTWTERLNATGRYPDTVGEVPFPAAPAATQDFLTTLGLEATSGGYYNRYMFGPNLTGTVHKQASENNKSIWENSGTSRPGRLEPDLDPSTASAKANPLYKEFRNMLDPTNQLGLPVRGPRLFDQTFQSGYRHLAQSYADQPATQAGVMGAVIENFPLSETHPLQNFPNTQINFITWLTTASFDHILKLNYSGIYSATNPKPSNFVAPNSLLFWLLRQAILLQYWKLGAAKLNLSLDERKEKELFNITASNEIARWEHLYSPVNGLPLHQLLRTGNIAESTTLSAYLEQVKTLAPLATARLERLLAEHLDLGSYRIDAWKTAQVAQRLFALRQTNALGSYIGAYGWLENVQVQDRSLPLASGAKQDPDNLGYIHAPSLNHALTAAVLRQGYRSRKLTDDANSAKHNRMAINLSSERVRKALAIGEGIRNGQTLSALLGLDFEAGLRRYTQTVTVNATAFALITWLPNFREKYPLTLASQLVEQEAASVELARAQGKQQVVDGLALVYASQGASYPYGVADLPSDENFQAAVEAEIAALADTIDALGDLAIGEGIYQAALGNREQASALLDSAAQGKLPVEPQLVHPPRSGTSLTHRILVSLPQADPASLITWGTTKTPRALAEPGLNRWLATFMTDVPTTAIEYTLYDPEDDESSIKFSELGLQPIDLLYLLDESALQAGSPFDTYLVARLTELALLDSNAGIDPRPLRPEVIYSDGYIPDGIVYLKQMLPLFRHLRALIAGSRAAMPNDYSLPGQLSPTADQDQESAVELSAVKTRLASAEAILYDLAQDISIIRANSLPTTSDIADARVALSKLLLFNLKEAQVALHAPDENFVSAVLVAQAEVGRRLVDYDNAIVETPTGSTTSFVRAAQALFGSGFRLTWSFTMPTERRAQYTSAFNANPAAAQLQDNPLLFIEWLQGLSRVREQVDHLDKVVLLDDLLETGASLSLHPVQLTSQADFTNDYWLGAEYATSATPPRDVISLMQVLPANYTLSTSHQALWLDEWTELIPHREQASTVAFHFDQPNTEAPQAVLLGISPQVSNAGKWTDEDVVGLLNETLDLAKKRTIEPDNLAFTHLGTLLPAIVAPVAQKAVTLTLDFRKVNQSARYQETPLT